MMSVNGEGRKEMCILRLELLLLLRWLMMEIQKFRGVFVRRVRLKFC